MGVVRAYLLELMARGGPVMWPLLACSLASLTLTIERLVFWWRTTSSRDDEVVGRMFERVERGDCEGAMDASRADPGACVRVLRNGLVHREHGLSEAMQVGAGDEIERMKQGLGVLDTIITMAPLLGILGTVTGIIQSFDLLGTSGIEDPKAVTAGIAQALITTAAGLTIAIATLVPYNYFVSRVQRAARRIEKIATQFEVAYRRGRDPATVD